MSRPRSKKQLLPRSRKQQPDPYTSRIKRQPSNHEIEQALRHHVRNRDYNALEDYDEKDLHPVGLNNSEITTGGEVVDDNFDWREEMHGGYDDDSDIDWYNDDE